MIIRFLQPLNNGARCAEGTQKGIWLCPHKPFHSTARVTLVRTPITRFVILLDAGWYGTVVLSLMPSSQIVRISPINNSHALSVMDSHSLLFNSCPAAALNASAVRHNGLLYISQWFPDPGEQRFFIRCMTLIAEHEKRLGTHLGYWAAALR